MSNSNKYRLDENITMLGPLALGILNYMTSKKVTDLKDAELDKRHGKAIQILDDPPEYTSKKSSRKIQKKSVIKYPEFMPPKFEIIDPSSTLLLDKSQYKVTEPQNIITLPSTCLHNTKLSTAKPLWTISILDYLLCTISLIPLLKRLLKLLSTHNLPHFV